MIKDTNKVGKIQGVKEPGGSKGQFERRREVRKVDLKVEEKLSVVSSTKWKAAPDNNWFRLRRSVAEMSASFTFEPLHNLQLGISKMLNQSDASNFSSESDLKSERGAETEQKPLLN